MRTLFLMRHAKSEWGDASLADHDRPLNERGRRAAAAIGNYMRANGLIPEAVITSSAIRACSTAELVIADSGWPITIEPRIYEATAGQLLDLVNGLSDMLTTVMFVGHEPTMSSLTARLTEVDVSMPTGTLAVITFDAASWSKVTIGSGNLRELIHPRSIE